MDINTRLYGVTELKAKDALRTMDIKARIDGLTESEAKAALYWAIQRVAVYGSCFVCDRDEKCKKDDGVDCDIEFLRQALKETRDERI